MILNPWRRLRELEARVGALESLPVTIDMPPRYDIGGQVVDVQALWRATSADYAGYLDDGDEWTIGGLPVNIGTELERIVADARGHGLTSIDLATLERLLHRRRYSRDLLGEPHAGMLVVDLHD